MKNNFIYIILILFLTQCAVKARPVLIIPADMPPSAKIV